MILLKHKLSALLALAAAAPIAVAGWSTLRLVERSAIESAEESAGADVKAAAAATSVAVNHVRDLMGLFASRSFDFHSLSVPDRIGAAKLIYELDDRITATSILFSDGRAAAPSYYRAAGESGTRATVDKSELEDHASHVPLAEALALGRAVSPIYKNHAGKLRVAIAAVADSDTGRAEDATVVVAEVALDSLLTATAEGATIFNSAGEAVSGPLGEQLSAASPGPLNSWPLIANVRTGDLLASYARVPGHEWGIARVQPLADVLAPARELRGQIIFWAIAGAFIALLTGTVFGHGIARPIEDLTRAAHALGSGDLEVRTEPVGSDEISELGRSFNRMAEDLSGSQRELRKLNRELEEKVRARTAELREAIEQLLMAHRLAAIGQLGAGMAHGINNPLTYLVGALQLMPTMPPENQPHMLAKCLDSARRIKEVVAGLLRVSQPQGDESKTPIDLNALVENALRLVSDRLESKAIIIDRSLAGGLPKVFADPTQITQALVQMFDNAGEAMPDGGKLSIETRGAVGDKLLVLRIADTGTGIPAEHLDRLFDPFFTTQAHEGHKGLGLSLAYRVVKDHGGSILPESDAEGGTRFTLRLPALPREHSMSLM